MKAKTCFRESPKERFERLSRQAAIRACSEPVSAPAALPLPDKRNFSRSNALVMVEVEGGVVQNVTLINQANHPVLVLVRDYDNYAAEPDDYQDAEWLLT